MEEPDPVGDGVETSAPADLSEDAGLFTAELVLAVLPGTGMELVCADPVGCVAVDRVGNTDDCFSSERFIRHFNSINYTIIIIIIIKFFNPFNASCSKSLLLEGFSAILWSNPPFLIFNIRALWRSVKV